MKITPDRIIEIVAAEYGLTRNNLVGPDRGKVATTARALAMDLICDRCGIPLGRIAPMFNRSYPTAYGNHKTFRKEILRAPWQDIERMLAARAKTFEGYAT